MDLRFEVAARIARPVEDVFDAVADPDKLSRYFTTGGANGRIEEGATLSWSFADHPGAFPIEVAAVEPCRRILLRWDAAEGSGPPKTEVEMLFEPLHDGRTLLRIREGGWSNSPEGLKASYGNCEGWTQMLCALKAWAEHGINLRDGFYK
jgi:uncharacterized protein YndB with AHSA1/START domain